MICNWFLSFEASLEEDRGWESGDGEATCCGFVWQRRREHSRISLIRTCLVTKCCSAKPQSPDPRHVTAQPTRPSSLLPPCCEPLVGRASQTHRKIRNYRESLGRGLPGRVRRGSPSPETRRRTLHISHSMTHISHSMTTSHNSRKRGAPIVDIIFLDIDGVLLPFGGDTKAEDAFTGGCIFPNRTMQALTVLLHKLRSVSMDQTVANPRNGSIRPHPSVDTSSVNGSVPTNNEDVSITNATSSATCSQLNCKTIQGNAVFVLSSTWRARPEFIQDILTSFGAYAIANHTDEAVAGIPVQQLWEPHLDSFFDICDPMYHATRHEEIYKWVNSHVNGRNSKAKGHQQYVVRSWIALDDEDIVNVKDVEEVNPNAFKHAVQPESSVGLAVEHSDIALQLVKDQMREFYCVS